MSYTLTDVAEELHRIADDLAALAADHPAPSFICLEFQPGKICAPEAAAEVDAIATALLGRPAQTEQVVSGIYHHRVAGLRGPIQLSIYQRVASPEDSELERLRAENARLRAAEEERAAKFRVTDAGRNVLTADEPADAKAAS